MKGKLSHKGYTGPKVIHLPQCKKSLLYHMTKNTTSSNIIYDFSGFKLHLNLAIYLVLHDKNLNTK